MITASRPSKGAEAGARPNYGVVLVAFLLRLIEHLPLQLPKRVAFSSRISARPISDWPEPVCWAVSHVQIILRYGSKSCSSLHDSAAHVRRLCTTFRRSTVSFVVRITRTWHSCVEL